jgi:hypothetical protein
VSGVVEDLPENLRAQVDEVTFEFNVEEATTGTE